MMDDIQTPALEAGAEDVSDDQIQDQDTDAPEADETPEAAEKTEGQVETPPADAEPAEEQTKSQQRRERRKQELARLKEAEAQMKADYQKAQAEAERLKAALQVSKPPVEADFGTYDQFQAALTSYYVSKGLDDRAVSDAERIAEDKQKQAEEVAQYQKQAAQENWAIQVQDAKAKYADFEKVAFTAPISDAVAEMIQTSDVGSEVAYALGKNPNAARALSRLSGAELAREMGRLEAMVSMPRPRTTTAAPAPITPVTESGSAQKDPAKMSPSEYRKWREAGGKF